MSSPDRRSGISLDRAIAPVIDSHAFRQGVSADRLTDFRDGEIAGTHAAENRTLDTSISEVVREAVDSANTYPVSDEFMLGVALRAYHVRESKRIDQANDDASEARRAA